MKMSTNMKKRLFLAALAAATGTLQAQAEPSSAAAPRVLIVTTSHAILGKTGYPTGLWLPELTHPWFELTQAGIEVDFASPKGGRPPIDPYSDPTNPNGINTDDVISTGFLNTPKHAENFNATLRLGEVDPSRYAAVIVAGGNGAVFDLRGQPDAQRVIKAVWSRGGVVGALCHGSAALLDIEIDGKKLVAGRKVTGFTNVEEGIAQKQIGAEYLPFYLQDELMKQGGVFQEGPPFQPALVVDGRLVTGQQNFSGSLVGRAVVDMLKHEKSPAAVARRFFDDLWNKRDYAVADALIPASSMSSMLLSGVPVAATRHPRDAAAMKAHIDEWLVAFPDLTFTIESISAGPEFVSTAFSARGTHRGLWFGLNATNKPADIKGVIVQKVVDGQIVEDWVMVDLLGVLQQLGVTKPMNELIAAANAR